MQSRPDLRKHNHDSSYSQINHRHDDTGPSGKRSVYVSPTVQIISGAGLTGGGDLSADRTLAVGAGTGILVNADDVALTAAVLASLALADTAVQPARNLIAGAGLTGGGDLSVDRTFTVGAGTGIAVNADDVALSAGSIASLALADTSLQSSILTTDGDIFIRSGGVVTRLAPGSNGQVLKLAGGLPAWGTDEVGAGGGGTVDTVVAGTGITVDSTDPANPIVAVNQAFAPTWTDTHKFTASTAFIIEGVNPFMLFNETDAAVDEKRWAIEIQAGLFIWKTQNDAVTIARDVMTWNRNGVGIDAFTFGNATDNPSYSFLGSGVTTFGGAIGVTTGTAALPSLSFAVDPDSGMYRVSANTIALATGGGQRVTVNVLGLRGAGHLMVDGGLDVGGSGRNWSGEGTRALMDVSGGAGRVGAFSYDAGAWQNFTINGGAMSFTSNTACSVSVPMHVSSLDVGHVSDTTLSRVSAGQVAIEGNQIWHAGNIVLASGTYTPTLTHDLNVASSSVSGTFNYMRVGNIVTVSGTVGIDPTSASVNTRFDISLPIASNFANTYDCHGVGNEDTLSTGAGNWHIRADSVNDRAECFITSIIGTANRLVSVVFTYRVI